VKKLIIILTLTFVASAQAQVADKTVTLTVSGSGKTKDEAKQSALKSAIEQAFGAFISTKTEMLNDQIVADQMSSVSSGNIKSYTILNESQLPDTSWGVTLRTVVSVDKLMSFVQAKGVVIEVKGGLFAINIKQQLLNEQGELNAINKMLCLIHDPLQISFDYTMKSGEPKSLDSESQNWEIPILVYAKANKNMDFCATYFIKTISSVSLPLEEVKSYRSLNKNVFPIEIYYKGISKTLYLRKQVSIDVITQLTKEWEFYTRLFTVQAGLKVYDGCGEGNLHVFSSDNETIKKKINFLTAGNLAATFSWKDKLNLSQLEQMAGYHVKAKGIIWPGFWTCDN
jgi:hypothetical protein